MEYNVSITLSQKELDSLFLIQTNKLDIDVVQKEELENLIGKIIKSAKGTFTLLDLIKIKGLV